MSRESILVYRNPTLKNAEIAAFCLSEGVAEVLFFDKNNKLLFQYNVNSENEARSLVKEVSVLINFRISFRVT